MTLTERKRRYSPGPSPWVGHQEGRVGVGHALIGCEESTRQWCWSSGCNSGVTNQPADPEQQLVLFRGSEVAA